MGKRLSPAEMRLYRLCDEALFYLWDPIGVRNAPAARNEYDSELPRVFGLIKTGDRDALIAFLVETSEEHMGSGRNEDRALAAADFLFKGWNWIQRTAEESVDDDTPRGIGQP